MILGLSVVPLHEVHRGLDQRVHQGEQLPEGVDGGAGTLGHQGQTQAGRLDRGS